MENEETNLKVIANFMVTISVQSKYTIIHCSNMIINSESYKGIEFVRISSLENQEKTIIRQTLGHGKIIKILRDNELLSDCIQYHDYLAWRNQNSEKTGAVSHLN